MRSWAITWSSIHPALTADRYHPGCWYAIQAVAEAGALGAIVVAAKRYSTDSDAILAAVQQVGGRCTCCEAACA